MNCNAPTLLHMRSRFRSPLQTISDLFYFCFAQVCQWLVVLGLDHHTASFYEHNVTGPELLLLESKELKTLGVGGEDKNKLKRKLKELRLHEERERKQADKERKEKEKLQKKAEKLAEKASKIRK